MAATPGKTVVMVAVDASEPAENAFAFYLKHMHRPEYEIRLAHIHELHAPLFPQALSTDDWKRTLKHHEEKIQKLQEKFEAKAKEHEVETTFEVVHGKPGEAICKYANEEKISMIVMGTRGLGTIRRTILGSVSGYVIHHAHCPVLVFRK